MDKYTFFKIANKHYYPDLVDNIWSYLADESLILFMFEETDMYRSIVNMQACSRFKTSRPAAAAALILASLENFSLVFRRVRVSVLRRFVTNGLLYLKHNLNQIYVDGSLEWVDKKYAKQIYDAVVDEFGKNPHNFASTLQQSLGFDFKTRFRFVTASDPISQVYFLYKDVPRLDRERVMPHS